MILLNLEKEYNEKIKFCIECDCYLTEKNDSKWEIFIDKSIKSYKICKSCYIKRNKIYTKAEEDIK